MPVEHWCTASVYERTCRSQVACGIAAADAGCAQIGANSRLVSAPDPCSPALLASLDGGGVHYDGRAAARCLHAQRTECGITGATRLACASVFVGEGAEGTACSFDQQCAGDLWCSFSAGVCPGACQVRVAPGGVATEPLSCATDLALPLDGGSFRCVDFQPLGSPCGADAPCSSGLRCDQGACSEYPPVGAACMDSDVCGYGRLCIGGRCAAFAKRGEPCASQFSPVNPGASPCQLGLACRAGTCGDALGVGESCLEEPNRCSADSLCDLSSSVCVRRATAGAACASTLECASPLLCAGGTCRAPAALGEPCDSTIRCEPTRVCLDGRCATSARECG